MLIVMVLRQEISKAALLARAVTANLIAVGLHELGPLILWCLGWPLPSFSIFVG